MNIKNAWKQAKDIAHNKKGSVSAGGMVGMLVAIILVVNLIPTVADTIGSAQNLTTAQSTILGLATTFIVLGVIVLVAKKSGLMSN